MPVSSSSDLNLNPRRCLFVARIAVLIFASAAVTPLLSQQSQDQKPSTTPPAAAKLQREPSAEKPQPKPDESAEAEASLVYLNNALEGLAAKVSPAVVQILVTGYAPIHEENRSQTAGETFAARPSSALLR